MTRPAPARMAAANGGRSTRRSSPSPTPIRTAPRSVLAAAAQAAREGRAEARGAGGAEAEAAALGVQSALGAHDVDHRREVDVHAGATQRRGGRADRKS